MPSTAYAELQVTSNFSFLRGASHPDELMVAAGALGLAAVAVTDRNSVAGIVRAHVAAKRVGVRLVVGCRLDLTEGEEHSLLCFPADRAAYGRMTQMLTAGKRRAKKGQCHLGWLDVVTHGEGQIFVALAPDDWQADDAALPAFLRRLGAAFPGQAYLAASFRYGGDDRTRIAELAALAEACGTPLVATNDVHYHVPARRPLQDVLTCIREGCTVDEAGFRLSAHAERHMKPPAEMARLFEGHEEALARTVEIAERCRFSLDELRYEYPEETSGGRDPMVELEAQVAAGAHRRYPEGVPAEVAKQIRHELDLIRRLDYPRYFLTVADIVRFARGEGILCQGRGSAANSTVCYCLDITAIDPVRAGFLFERFISAARNEPPDIDVDFEHERREEVIQYIYAKYGRDRAGLAATVIHYRSRAAIRDVAKVLGLSPDVAGSIAATVWGWSSDGYDEAKVREAGLDPLDRRIRLALDLSRTLIGFPRHLSQHVGGFVMTRGPLSELVPIENAAMDDRTVIEWDKDDIDALGILKVDVLALGMLTAVRRALDLIAAHGGGRWELATIPPEDAAVYAMISRADTVGVFQIESRAQMTMLPRLQPRCFYDLVIEVAIVRPGPIQGDMVHPYLRRRQGREEVTYPPKLRPVLEKTLGVPLFQEQAMKIAIVAAGFSPDDADRLRRSMATFKHVGTIHQFRERFIGGMIGNGYDPDFAERCFKQIEGFGTYGFPESHAASFAILVYASAWIKHHHPAAFAAALLNSQPMGFYAPAQLVRDAAEHGVEVRPVDVNFSDWDCTLERRPDGALALRLGLRQAKGLSQKDGVALVKHRGGRPYADPAAIWRRAGLNPGALECLARADAYGSMGLDRRAALWAVRQLGDAPLPLFAAVDGERAPVDHPRPEEARRAVSKGGDDRATDIRPPSDRPSCFETPSSTAPQHEGLVERSAEVPAEFGAEPAVVLPEMSLPEAVMRDYAALRLSLKEHPMAFLRARLAREGRVPTAALKDSRNGRRLATAGLVLVRQRPGTASGVIFVTLEDETGIANLVVWPGVFEQFRRTVLTAGVLCAEGRVQREGDVIHLVVERLTDLSDRLRALWDGGVPIEQARADEAKPGGPGRRKPLPVESRDFR